jgi:hypothetical protein
LQQGGSVSQGRFDDNFDNYGYGSYGALSKEEKLARVAVRWTWSEMEREVNMRLTMIDCERDEYLGAAMECIMDEAADHAMAIQECKRETEAALELATVAQEEAHFCREASHSMVIEAQEEMELQREEMQRVKRAFERSNGQDSLPHTEIWAADRSLSTSPGRAGYFVTPGASPNQFPIEFEDEESPTAPSLMSTEGLRLSPRDLSPEMSSRVYRCVGTAATKHGPVSPPRSASPMSQKTRNAEKHNRDASGGWW